MVKRNSDKQNNNNEYWLDRQEHRYRTHQWRRSSRKERRRERLIRDWYGSDVAQGMMLERHRPANKMGDCVDSVLRRIAPQQMLLMEQLKENWASIIGDDNARNSRPLRLNENVLEIEVVNPSWMYVLSTMHGETIKKAVKDFSNGKIDNIRFKPGGRNRPGV